MSSIKDDIKEAASLVLEKHKTKIKNIFKIIGAAEATANLLCEFNIAEKKDDKLTNNKNGKVILVRLIAISNFSESSVKPGAINETNNGIKISIIKTIKSLSLIHI